MDSVVSEKAPAPSRTVVNTDDTPEKDDTEDFGLGCALVRFEDPSTTPDVKCEPVLQNDGPVSMAIRRNFDCVVTNNGQDMLNEFHAPACDQCKKLTPIFDEFSTNMEDEDVVILKIDATTNDVPPAFKVRSFPTFSWLLKDGNSRPQQYHGQCGQTQKVGREIKPNRENLYILQNWKLHPHDVFVTFKSLFKL